MAEHENEQPLQQKRIAIACQGGGSHAAFCAGVLSELFGDAAPGQEKLSTPIQEKFIIHGLSGTSGGAICAALAWYGLLRNSTLSPEGGLLLGSPVECLKAFWNANSAHGLMESLFNNWAVLLAEIPFDIKASPYDWGSRVLEWQRDVAFSRRPEFIHFEVLLTEHLKFDHIQAVMEPLAILKEALARLNVSAFQNIGDIVGNLPPHDGPIPPLLSQRLKRAVGAIGKLPGFAGVKDLIDGLVARLAGNKLTDLVAMLDVYSRSIPLLVVGSVDVKSGEFKAFSSKDGPITLDMVRASAAIPELFRAVSIEKSVYWDGLFSQNPPITNFLSVTDAADGKPDEIWVIQVNPQERDEEPTNASTISDRRNELSGNLSLNQEISAIQMISRLVEDPNITLSSNRIKRIDVFRIPMNSAAFEAEHGRDLNLASKLDRDIAFTGQLIQHGRRQGQAFRFVRHIVQNVWNNPNPTTVPTASHILPIYQPIGQLHGLFNGLYITIGRTEIIANSRSATAVLGWQGRGVDRLNGVDNYEITGVATLKVDLNVPISQPPAYLVFSNIKVELIP